MPDRKRTHPAPGRGCLLGIAALFILAVVVPPVWWQVAGRELRFRREFEAVQGRFQRGKLNGVRNDLLKLHAQSPGNIDVVTLLANLAEQTDEPKEAIKWYCQVPESSPEQAAWARLRAAELAMRQADVASAESLAGDALRLDGSIAAARRLVLRIQHVLLRTRDLQQQVRELDARGELTVQDAAYYCLGHRMTWDDEARVWLQQCLERNPSQDAVRAALIRFNQWSDRPAAAQQLLAAAVPGGPEAWRLDLIRAEQFAVDGDDRAAANILAGLPGDADADSRVWLARGRIWKNLGDPQAARQALDNAATLDPYDPAATIAIARLLEDEGRSEEAALLAERSQRQHQLQEAIRRTMTAIETESAWPVEQLELAAAHCQALGLSRESDIFLRAAAMREVEPVPPPTAGGDSPTAELAFASLERLTPVVWHEPAAAGGAPAVAAARGDAASGLELRLTDIAARLELKFAYDTGRSPSRWLIETLGGGVAAFDFDVDGWPDLFFSQGNRLPLGAAAGGKSNCLFQNQDGRRVADVTRPAGLTHAGYGHGCAVGDIDNDGFPDLVVCNYGAVLVYRNLGDGTFEDVTRESGVTSSEWSTSAVFFDLDRDGDLDLYVANYLHAPFAALVPCKSGRHYVACHPSTLAAAQDVYWENQGDGRFLDRTREAGLIAANGKGLGLMVADFDLDGLPSIFVGNDSTPNSLFESSTSAAPPSPLTDVAFKLGVAVNEDGAAEACMGVACGDVDNDGRFDLFVTNFEGETNTLYRNVDGRTFMDVTRRAELAHASREKLGFGCQFIDIDANGWLDLFIANGHLHEHAQHPQLFYNLGGIRFRNSSARAGDYFGQPRLGRSVAVIDIDRDLLADLAVTYQEGNVSVLHNESRAGNRLALDLVGLASNRDAVGALVRATVDGRQRTFRVDRCGGYMAANQPTVLIGCGAAEVVGQLEVTWPSGHVDRWDNLAVGRSYLAREGTRDLVISGGARRRATFGGVTN